MFYSDNLCIQPLKMSRFAEYAFGSQESEGESVNDTPDVYPYQTLHHAHAMRLLRLRPASKETSEVECELFEDNLENKPQYEALSWSWGDESWGSGIQISQDGTTYLFEVPEALVSALKALRRRRKSRVLWIDAICINQGSADEKNRQGKLDGESGC